MVFLATANINTNALVLQESLVVVRAMFIAIENNNSTVDLKSAISAYSAIDRYQAWQGARYGEHGRAV